MLILHDPRCEDYWGSPAHPERPARVKETVPVLRAAHPNWMWRAPTAAPDELLLLAHSAAHLRRLNEARDFDPDTLWVPGIAGHARRAAGAAIEAARWAHETHSPVFSLMRPPGHHASTDAASGFCYLNQIAIAALAVRRDPGVARVAIWDFDAHHGNGTEGILRDREDFLFCSVHQFPGYPGTGATGSGNCRNWPVPPGSSRTSHLKSLRASWETVVAFNPSLVLVSAGFDAYVHDPLTQMTLERDDFAELGEWLGRSGLVTAAILEGGYSEELPGLIDAFLSAWEDSRRP